MGVEYEEIYNKLAKRLNSNNIYNKCYSAILLMQLRNGLRISEAVKAFKKYLYTSNNVIYVKVSKKKREEERMVVTPSEFDYNSLEVCKELVSEDDDVIKERVRNWFRINFKLNTHSLRYAFITYLLRQGVNPALIAKITKHSRLDYILVYTQTKAAEEVLKNM